MVAAVFTIILGVIAFVMFSKPMFWSYTGEGGDFNYNTSCYDVLRFDSAENIYNLLGQIFLLIGMIFAGLMILLALAHLFGKAAGNEKPRVEVRLIACGFFFFMLLAAVMFILYKLQETGGTKIDDILNSTVGYGFLSAMGAALLSIFFAPSRRKGMRKKKEKKVKEKKIKNKEVKTQNAEVKEAK